MPNSQKSYSIWDYSKQRGLSLLKPGNSSCIGGRNRNSVAEIESHYKELGTWEG